jgi:hypothetical protein
MRLSYRIYPVESPRFPILTAMEQTQQQLRKHENNSDNSAQYFPRHAKLRTRCCFGYKIFRLVSITSGIEIMLGHLSSDLY